MIRPELKKKIDQAIKLLRQIPLADGEYVEVWKDISGYEDKYQVSNCGNVRSLEYHNAKGLKRTKNLKPATDCKGYLRCALSKNNILRTFKVHRLVAMAFLENPNNLPQVNHKDGNKKNNRVDNLEWSDNSQNIQHAYNNGLIRHHHGWRATKIRIKNNTEEKVFDMKISAAAYLGYKSIRPINRALSLGISVKGYEISKMI